MNSLIVWKDLPWSQREQKAACWTIVTIIFLYFTGLCIDRQFLHCLADFCQLHNFYFLVPVMCWCSWHWNISLWTKLCVFDGWGNIWASSLKVTGKSVATWIHLFSWNENIYSNFSHTSKHTSFEHNAGIINGFINLKQSWPLNFPNQLN